jgi:uncharacterized protein
MVDAQIDRFDGLSQIWDKFNPPLGKFAVTGNHEYYAGPAQSVEFMRECGFEVVRNSIISVNERLSIAGVDDPASGEQIREFTIFNCADKNKYIILLKHRPDVDPMSEGLFDLQLSGHAHRGQMFPFNFITAMQYPKQNGLYKLNHKSHLYTSRGTGTWGPPMRILSPPEITVITITPEK